MSIKCPYCEAEQKEEKAKGELMRCCSCQKVFEVGSIPAIRKSASAANQQQRPATKSRPPANLEYTEYQTGLAVATISIFIGYFLLVVAGIVVLFSIFSGHMMQGILTAVAMIVASILILIGGFSAKAIMKSADYLRVIAERTD